MGSKSNAAAQDDLDLIFLGTAIADIAENDTTSPATNWYVALHTANPGKTGTQATSEVSNAGYARVAVARTGSGWQRSAQTVSNVAAIVFPAITGGADVKAKFWSIGKGASGATPIRYFGPIGGTRLAFTAVAGATDVLTIPGHSFVTTTGLNKIVFWSSPGATLPSNIVEGTEYFVKTVSGNDITISATDGGAQFDTGGAGAGFAQGISDIPIAINVEPRAAAGAITITES